jgi:hypothetical protein
VDKMLDFASNRCHSSVEAGREMRDASHYLK